MAGRINCVIVKDLSRLGREYIETGRYLRQLFPSYGVRFIAINDDIDTANEHSGDDLIVGVKNLVNDTYCRDISVKTRTALMVKRKNGDYVGACPVYGYQKAPENKNRLVIDNDAARVVRDIFRRRINGVSARKIADDLNEHQELYDQAANSGFPPGFFRKTYFDRVTLYCLPDAQDCSESAFNLCSFTVCRINSADFESSVFFNCEFHTCDIVSASFYRAVLDNCRFHDSHCENVSFESALLKSCSFTDGKMKGTNYRNAILDGRFFRLYMFTALAPLPLASFAGEGTSGSGRAFIKSYIGVCMEGAVIVLACLIYSAFLSSSTPAVDASLPAVTMAWEYIGQLIFNMLILTGLVRGASRIVKEMFGL